MNHFTGIDDGTPAFNNLKAQKGPRYCTTCGNETRWNEMSCPLCGQDTSPENTGPSTQLVEVVEIDTEDQYSGYELLWDYDAQAWEKSFWDSKQVDFDFCRKQGTFTRCLTCNWLDRDTGECDLPYETVSRLDGARLIARAVKDRAVRKACRRGFEALIIEAR